jgi:hypothetical protein
MVRFKERTLVVGKECGGDGRRPFKQRGGAVEEGGGRWVAATRRGGAGEGRGGPAQRPTPAQSRRAWAGGTRSHKTVEVGALTGGPRL